MRPQRQIDQLLTQSVPWLRKPAGEPDIALCSRLRLTRNISGYPFPGQASVPQRREIQLRVADAVSGVDSLANCLQFDLTSLPKLEQQLLVERQLLDVMPSGGQTEGLSLCVSLDESISLVTNDLDHLRLGLLRPDLDLEQLWQDASEAAGSLGRELPWVFDTKLGYLTARPHDLGTAMFASIVMHLPGLALAERLDQIANGLSHMGFVMTGLVAEDGQAVGNLFEIGNQSGLGESEESLIQRLGRVAGDLIVQEKHARQSLLEQRPQVIFDYVGRAYGFLRHAWVLTSTDTLGLLAALRFGLDLGMITAVDAATLDLYFARSQPAHLQRFLGRPLDEHERDVERARLMREWLATAGKEAPGKG